MIVLDEVVKQVKKNQQSLKRFREYFKNRKYDEIQTLEDIKIVPDIVDGSQYVIIKINDEQYISYGSVVLNQARLIKHLIEEGKLELPCEINPTEQKYHRLFDDRF